MPPETFDRDGLKAALIGAYPDYAIVPRGKRKIIIAKDSKVGARLKVKKKSVVIEPRLPTKTGHFLWILSLILFGVILPILAYTFTRRPKMRRFQKEIGATIESWV